MVGRREEPSTEGADRLKGYDDFELRLGDMMRGERATLGKSLLDVQRELKIKASYIAAIENCDVSAFDTPGFVAGYVRSYARYLGMDADTAFRRFCEESDFTVAHGMSVAASPRRAPSQSRATRKSDYADPLANPRAPFVPRGEAFMSQIQPGAIGSILVLLTLIGGIGYGGWTVFQQVQRVQVAPVDQPPGVIAELDPVDATAETGAASGASEIALNSQPASGTRPDGPGPLDRLYRPETLDAPIMIARDSPIAAIDPDTVGALAGLKKAGLKTPAALAEAAPSSLDETPVQVVAEAPPPVELLAVRPAWVRVSAADGSVIFEKILDAGERYALPSLESEAKLRVGESGALYFAVNGKTYGPAGKRGVVTKDLVLSPETLTERYAVADLDSDADLAQFVAVADASSLVPQEDPSAQPAVE